MEWSFLNKDEFRKPLFDYAIRNKKRVKVSKE